MLYSLRSGAAAISWPSLVLLPIAFGLFACDCSDSGTNGDGDGGVTPPCEQSDPPPSCGDTCDGDQDCEGATHCGPSGECTAACGPTAPCAGGAACDADGRCEPAGPDACVDVELSPQRVVPNIVLLVDKSGSMEAQDVDMGDGATLRRWNALRELLIGQCATPKRDPDESNNGRQCSECTELAAGSLGIVGQTEELINYGLMIYPAGAGETLCGQRHTVPVAERNYEAIRDMFMETRCAGGTPTRAAFEDVMTQLYDPDDPDPTIVILATDGAPNHCQCRSGFSGGSCGSNICCAANQGPTETAVVNEVESAFVNESVETYVIAISNEVAGNPHFQEVANVGQGLARDGSEGNATLYEASEGDQLSQALLEIISSHIPCEIDLRATVAAADICRGTVILDGNVLECNGADGFERVDDGHIRLLGDACDAWKSDSNATLEATWPCGLVIITPD